jgi:predicted P-loop ATPase
MRGQCCSCGNAKCNAPAKHPANPNGLTGATQDKEQIGRWFGNGHNIGLAVGPEHVVIDVDPRNGGEITLVELQLKYEDLPPTLTCRTGGGGWHFYFRTPVPIRCDSLGRVLGKGIDIKGNGGYVIAPPSVHESMQLYYFDESKPRVMEDCPKWLLDLMTADRNGETKLLPPAATADFIVSGARNVALARMAGAMRRQGIDRATIVQALIAENRLKCRPPLSKEEVIKCATSISKYAPAQASVADWRMMLKKSKDGIIKASASNAAIIMTMDDNWKGALGFDEFREKMIWRKDPPDGMFRPKLGSEFADDDLLYCQNWLAKWQGPSFSTENLFVAAKAVARQNRYNSLTSHLSGLEWDEVPRLRNWLSTYAQAKDTPVVSQMGRWWLLSAIARAFEPGCQADHVLVLEGEKGDGKTSISRIVGGDFFCEGLPTINHQYIGIMMAGKWIIEIGELGSFTKVSWQKVKQFITQKTDLYKEPYAKVATDRPRNGVFIGTTNPGEYIEEHDERRFWPVTVGKVDLVAFERDRDQVLAEAVACYKAGEKWYPLAKSTDLAEEQEDRRVRDVWEDRVLTYLVGRVKDGTVTTSEILSFIGVDPAMQNRGHEMRTGKIMRGLGWAPGRVQRGGYRIRGWMPLPAWELKLKSMT